MKNEVLKFNGFYAVVDDCDSIFYESESYDDSLDYYDSNSNGELYLTREMDVYSHGMVEAGFTEFQPVSIDF